MTDRQIIDAQQWQQLATELGDASLLALVLTFLDDLSEEWTALADELREITSVEQAFGRVRSLLHCHAGTAGSFGLTWIQQYFLEQETFWCGLPASVRTRSMMAAYVVDVHATLIPIILQSRTAILPSHE